MNMRKLVEYVVSILRIIIVALEGCALRIALYSASSSKIGRALRAPMPRVGWGRLEGSVACKTKTFRETQYQLAQNAGHIWPCFLAAAHYYTFYRF